MAKLITKFKYLKPNARQSVGGYAKYIATREGVDKIDQSYKLSPSSLKQQQLIEKILKDFPDSREMLEYEDYTKEPTVGNASEFITRALEDNAYEVMQTKTYADYIATRPRAERFGTHGLFTDDGKPVKLSEVSDELNHHGGNVWTVIISLRREDAERLGYNHGERWRDMLRTKTTPIAKCFKIPMEDLRWYAAFHNESHHPHVHLMVYSAESQKPYLSRQALMSLRSSLAREIFEDDLREIYQRQTEHRDDLRLHSSQLIAEIVEKINSGVYDNPKVESMLKELADRLYRTGGKKQYGYLKPELKAIVNRIVMELAADERIASLYDLWYEQREAVLKIYTDELPERIPLVDNEEFKTVKNAVITEAMNILAEITPVDETMDDFVIEDTEPEPEEMERAEQEKESAAPMSDRERISAMWRYYRQAKELLDRESEDYDPSRAVDLLIESAKLGCDVAKYRLGKMFLRGDDVAKNVDYALRWLEEAVADGNQYAEYLLGKTLLRGEDTEQDLPRAEDLLKRSSDKGNRYAKYTLGKAYLEGLLLLQNIPEAIRLLTESADSGFAPAQYLLGKLLSQGEVVPKDLERAIDYLERAAGQDNPYAAYLAGKLRLTEEDIKDILRAIKNFEIAAENGNHFAEYQLGKLYLYGREIDRDYDKAIAYLTSAAEHGNQYAEQLLHSIKSNKNWSAAMGSIRLLHHLARLLQNRLEDERKDKIGGIDRKLKRKIDEKKQAHGIKQ